LADFTIILGNKNYSSLSLRGWLALEAGYEVSLRNDAQFDAAVELLIDRPAYLAALEGKAPVTAVAEGERETDDSVTLHVEPAGAQRVESLRTRHLMDEVQIDIQDGGRVFRFRGNDVLIPDLVKQGSP